MRTLSTLATLLLGLAFVFWAPPAKADHDRRRQRRCRRLHTIAMLMVEFASVLSVLTTFSILQMISRLT